MKRGNIGYIAWNLNFYDKKNVIWSISFGKDKFFFEMFVDML